MFPTVHGVVSQGGGGGDGTEHVGFVEINDTFTNQSNTNRVGNEIIVAAPITVVAFRANRPITNFRLWSVATETVVASDLTGDASDSDDGTWFRHDITPVSIPAGTYRLLSGSGESRNHLFAFDANMASLVTTGPEITFVGAVQATNNNYPSGAVDTTRIRGIVDIIYTVD